ncbi:MAG: dockerin type I repeat-containing protein [Clostridia bacterium]|nr:dockerin type I repeat-containing protein [Clostridia bacterium]
MDGYTGDTYCNGCGAIISTGTVVPATGKHTWDDGKITKAATCKATGVKTYTCSACKKTKTETLVKDTDNHAGGKEIRNKKAATCSSDGYTGDRYCKGCGVMISTGTVVPATGKHTWDVGKITTAATCTATGERVYTCTICDQTRIETIPAAGHKLIETEAKAATCTGSGNVQYYYCFVCGKKFSDAEGKTEIADVWVKAKGHSFGEWKVTKEATIDEEGIETRKCSECGEEETRPIAKLGIVYIIGDVNGDGRILADDARLALRASAKLEKLSPAQMLAADANGDGQVLADDARLILRFSAKLQKEFLKS